MFSLKWLNLCILIHCCGFLNAQTAVRGTIRDEETKASIPYASIKINGTDYGLITDSLGHYDFIIPKLDKRVTRLTISSIGYKDIVVSLKALDKDLYLQREYKDITEVVVGRTVKELGQDSSRWWLTAAFYTTKNSFEEFTLRRVNSVFITSPSNKPGDSVINRYRTNYLSILRSLGRLYIYNEKKPAKLLEASFRLYPENLKEINFRINILDAKSEKTVLSRPINLKWQEGDSAKYQVDLKEENIIIQKDFIVLIEFLSGALLPGTVATTTIHGVPDKKLETAIYQGLWQQKISRASGFIPAIRVKISY